MTPTIPITWTKRPIRWPRLTVGLVLLVCGIGGVLILGFVAIVVAYLLRSLPLAPPLLLACTGVCVGAAAAVLIMWRGR